jgi:hypothetical protein
MSLQTVHIYGLTEPGTDFVRYVGYAVNLRKRFCTHLNEAKHKTGTHKLHWLRFLLERDQKPGMVVLETTDEEHYKEREIHWITMLKSTNNLTNSTDGGDGMLNPPDDVRRKIGEASSRYNSTRRKQPAQGLIHSEESHVKMREAAKNKDWTRVLEANKKRIGVPKSEEHCAKIGDGNRGKKRSPETIARMSETNKGKQNWLGKHHTEEAKAKISASKLGKTPWLGKHHTEKTKALLGEKSKGRVWSEESKEKMRVTSTGNQHALGMRHTEETKARMSAARMGNTYAAGNHAPKSAEHKAKIAAGLAAYRARKKQQQEQAA